MKAETLLLYLKGDINMINKKFIIILIIIPLLMNFFLFSQSEGDSSIDSTDLYEDPVSEDPVSENPAASLSEPEMTEPTPEPRYTGLEFSNLTDEEKRDVYFNFPWLLPENFDPDEYMDIFHPQSSTSLE